VAVELPGVKSKLKTLLEVVGPTTDDGREPPPPTIPSLHLEAPANVDGPSCWMDEDGREILSKRDDWSLFVLLPQKRTLLVEEGVADNGKFAAPVEELDNSLRLSSSFPSDTPVGPRLRCCDDDDDDDEILDMTKSACNPQISQSTLNEHQKDRNKSF
jgi:hypothetical protein